MKRKWYRSNGIKSILVLLEIVVITAVILTGGFCMVLLEQGIRGFDKDAGNYLKSDSFEQTMFERSCSVLRCIEEMRRLDRFSDNDVVSVDAYLVNGDISTEKSGTLKYRVEDLQKWNEAIVGEYLLYRDAETVIVCQTMDDKYEYFYLDDFWDKVMDGELRIVREDNGYSNVSDEDIVRSLAGQLHGYEDCIDYITDKEGRMLYDSVWNYGSGAVKEQYAPIGAENLLEVINKNPKWNGRLSEVYEALADIMQELTDYQSVKKDLDRYAEGNTNLTYLYVDRETREVFTNNSDYENYSGYERAMREMTGGDDPFILVQPSLSDCDTNLDTDSSLQQWNHIIDSYSRSKDYAYAVCVDKDFPIKDEMYYSREDYEKYAPYFLPAAVGCVVSLVLFGIGLFWLTAIAGRRPEDEEMHLCFFDRWWTEIGAGTVIGAGIFLVFICCETLAYSNMQQLQFWVIVTAAAPAMAALCLIGYLSLVRRIKAHTIWKNSMLRWLLKLLGRFWRWIYGFISIYGLNTGGKIKNTLILGGFMILQLCLALMAWESAFPLMLLFVLDLAAIVYCMWKNDGRDRILEGLRKISEGELQYKIPVDKLKGDQKEIAERINSIGQGLDAAVENSLKNERMKTELITNVSHDLKTPLTSIINYVDLLKRENFTDPKICGYLDVLEQKAQRLKVLTEDVVEASKASTGNINLDLADLNFTEMVQQAAGEFEEKFRERNLTMIVTLDEAPMMIRADGRRLWRVLENVFQNAVKYAMEGTRVYVELKASGMQAVFSMKNVSEQPLNISADELTERFIRGDVSRNTEGSGLGLSIAKSLTELQGGNFQLYLDGDLFKVMITFPIK